MLADHIRLCIGGHRSAAQPAAAAGGGGWGDGDGDGNGDGGGGGGWSDFEGGVGVGANARRGRTLLHGARRPGGGEGDRARQAPLGGFLSRESLDAAAAFAGEFHVEDAEAGGLSRPATSALAWGAAAAAAAASGGGGGARGSRREPLPEFETEEAGAWFRSRHHDSGDC